MFQVIASRKVKKKEAQKFWMKRTKILVPVGKQHNNRFCLKIQEPFTVKRKELKAE